MRHGWRNFSCGATNSILQQQQLTQLWRALVRIEHELQQIPSMLRTERVHSLFSVHRRGLSIAMDY